MTKKKLNSFDNLGGFVYSTNDQEDFKSFSGEESTVLKPSEQRLEAHFSNKGRGGKTVTIVKGFEGNEEGLKSLAKLLKSKCSVGGTVKDGEIIVQGNFRDKIIEILKKEGYQVKRIGG